MPGSAITVKTQSSAGGSDASRRAKNRRYFTVSRDARVDESLFGKPNREVDRDRRASEHVDDIVVEAEERNFRRRSSTKKKPQTVKVITKDLIRNLIVPREDPTGQSIIIPRHDIDRIREAARILTAEEEAAREEMHRRERANAVEMSETRKAEMRRADVDRSTNEALTDLELEAKQKAETLLENANLQRLESEDEVKHLNELILEAKCHAIRDAQLLEKEQVARELQAEERRLDHMMEVERRAAIAVQEAIEKRRKEEQLMGAAKLCEQITENEHEKLFELEKKDQENMQIKKYLEKLMDEDRLKIEKRRAQQTTLREQLNEANAEILKRKELEGEREKLLELRVLEFQREKAEREAAFEAAQEKAKIEKEMEVARLRSLQERAHDEASERDALRAKREQERVEREWRKKTAEEQRHKAEVDAALTVARQLQMEQKEHYVAVQAQRERADFERVLMAQKELLAKNAAEEEESRKKRHVHSDSIRKQIRQKESERIAERQKFFEEGKHLDEEARQRRIRLDAVKQKKLDELRSVGIHEKYLAEVERKAHTQPQSVTA